MGLLDDSNPKYGPPDVLRPAPPDGLLGLLGSALPDGAARSAVRSLQRALRPVSGANPITFLGGLLGLDNPLSVIGAPIPESGLLVGHADDVAQAAKRVQGPLTGTRVVDEMGNPKRVFHGSVKAFNNFDPAKIDPNGLYGPGLYFTESADVAGGYTTKGASSSPRGREFWDRLVAQNERFLRDGTYDGHSPLSAEQRAIAERNLREGRRELTKYDQESLNIRPARLAVRNPFDIEADIPYTEQARLLELAGSPKERIALLRGSAGSAPAIGSRGEGFYDELVRTTGSKAAANKLLQSAGYDGITHIGGGKWGDGTKPHRVWITFDRSQVRSPWGDPEKAVQFGLLGGLLAGGAATYSPKKKAGD